MAATTAGPRSALILGGNRIPFARANGPLARASNQDMLTAALDGLVARFGLAGESVGEVAAGAVLKHSRDYNLTGRVFSAVSCRLAPPVMTCSRPVAPAWRPRSWWPTRSPWARSTPE